MVAVGATELIESLGPQAIDDILVGHYVPLLEFNRNGREHIDRQTLNETNWVRPSERRQRAELLV